MHDNSGHRVKIDWVFSTHPVSEKRSGKLKSFMASTGAVYEKSPKYGPGVSL
ncbi:MAG: hypothetical protein MUD12_13805 [Spirochaetes bacterium]|nr:hypothetical protein [Spirochaetota bacterium]